MDEISLDERQLILTLALQEAYRKRDECQFDINELDNKLTLMTIEDSSFTEKDKVVESIMYLQECRDGWQDTIDNTRKWQDQLK